MDSPPTVYKGRVLFGSSDGYVYSLKGGWGEFGMAGKIAPVGRILVADDDNVYGYGQKPEFLTESIITECSLYAADKKGSSSAVKEFMKIGGDMWYPGAGNWEEGQSLPEIQMSAVQFKWQVDKPDIFRFFAGYTKAGKIESERLMFFNRTKVPPVNE